MVFNSMFFFVTLVLFLSIYFVALRYSYGLAKFFTLAYSYFFYGMWNPTFLLLLFMATVVAFFAARWIAMHPSRKRLVLGAVLVYNLGAIAFFKYCNFILSSTSYLAQLWGSSLSVPVLDVVLPVGISFYTFHTLSYVVDVYRGDLRADNSILNVAVFVAFFPLLVAGPIIRGKLFFPQLLLRPKITYEGLDKGLLLIIVGLFLKCVVADNVAPQADSLFAAWQSNGGVQTWLAATLFGIQIWGDFSGYSMVAIDLAAVMGYAIPKNFDHPYGAKGFSDFWRRWHISLSSWLRDYLYIPLGGNKLGTGRTYLNLMTTMLLGGLWHGASMMFVLWGGLHGLFLCLERAIRSLLADVHFPHWLVLPIEIALSVVTVVAVSIAWIPFRAQSIDQCFGMIARLVSAPSGCPTKGELIEIAFVLSILCLHMFGARRNLLERCCSNPFGKSVIIMICLLALYLVPGGRSAFIYFQF